MFQGRFCVKSFKFRAKMSELPSEIQDPELGRPQLSEPNHPEKVLEAGSLTQNDPANILSPVKHVMIGVRGKYDGNTSVQIVLFGPDNKTSIIAHMHGRLICLLRYCHINAKHQEHALVRCILWRIVQWFSELLGCTFFSGFPWPQLKLHCGVIDWEVVRTTQRMWRERKRWPCHARHSSQQQSRYMQALAIRAWLWVVDDIHEYRRWSINTNHQRCKRWGLINAL